MGNEVCRIAFSKEHWFSPFKINQNEKASLSTKEKIISISVAVFSLLFAPFSFYLLTAYFKARKIHDLNPAEKVDLNDDVIEDGVIVKSKCSSTNETIFIHKGFGDFRLNEILQPIQCPCCRQVEKINELILKHCKYSCEILKDFAEPPEKPQVIAVPEQSIQQIKRFLMSASWKQPGKFIPSRKKRDCFFHFKSCTYVLEN
ncbi:MAG: hypothetical protein HWD61_01625 [Parachlamydiaceae bacterium]|nr:MAG: hypothetical protein HWD61_01625 [Parachlamydiaceae bacterium]